eukprot:TCONS_00006835-protein
MALHLLISQMFFLRKEGRRNVGQGGGYNHHLRHHFVGLNVTVPPFFRFASMNGITWAKIYEIFLLFHYSNKQFLKFFRPCANSVFRASDNDGVVLLNRLRVGFSHLRDHKFRHNFADTIDPFCNCRSNSVETTQHFLMHCSDYSNNRLVMFDSLLQLDITLFPFNSKTLCRILLYGEPDFSIIQNHDILSITIKFICDTSRFGGPLF